jgi:beta-lactamase class A
MLPAMTPRRRHLLGWAVPVAVLAAVTMIMIGGTGAPGTAPAGDPYAAAAPAAGPSTPGPAAPDPSPPASGAPRPRPAPTPHTTVIRLPVPDGGHLAVAVLDLATGRQVVANGGERFHTASIVKVDILAALLWQEQRGGRTMTAAQAALATRMIEVSDNTAADTLFALIGKQSGLAEANRAFGLTHTTPGTTTVHPWGQTLTTAGDQLRLLRVVSGPGGPLTTDRRAYILALMNGVAGGQRWGVPAAARHGAAVYVKDGWLAEQSDGWLWIVNSIGRIVEPGHDLLVVTLSDHGGSEGAGITAVERAATAAAAGLGAAR